MLFLFFYTRYVNYLIKIKSLIKKFKLKIFKNNFYAQKVNVYALYNVIF